MTSTPKARRTADDLLALLAAMLRIRRFEQRIEALYAAGTMSGTFHSSEGQEAVPVGVCTALHGDDLVGSSHRGHGHFIAKGGNLGRMAAELFGRVDGYSAGHGGTQHMAGYEVGFLGSNGITGGGIPIATGAALAIKRRGEPRVVASFFGDGAANQGAFHESLNMAAIWKLPILYVCENNRFSMGSHVSDMVSVENIAERGASYAMPSEIVDGNDVEAVVEAAGRLVGEIRAGGGPRLLECKTYRVRGHSKSDKAEYRSDEEFAAWAKRDPIARLERTLQDECDVSASSIESVKEKIETELDAALDFAEKSPKGGRDVALRYVFASPLESPESMDPSQSEPAGAVREMFFWEAIQTAMREALDADERVFLYGEDIGAYGGAFKVTRGMLDAYGPMRVIDTPVSENAILGTATGAALVGERPIVEMMFMDFLLLAFDQLVNHAAKFHYIYAGQCKVPLVVRLPAGGYRGYGATHSQCLESMLMGVPGLKIVAPSTPRDARGLLATAIADDDPVLFIEHKLLYGRRGPVPEAPERIPLGRAKVVRPGDDLTLVGYAWSTHLCLEAAEQLAAAGIQAEVIDLRSLAPLDIDTVTESVMRTQRAVICEEGPRVGGVGGELAAALQESAFGYLDAPILRVGAASTPVPAAPDQEREVLPSVGSIVAAARQLMA